ncbi:hypothetical protein QJS10_CPA09g00795 [Acorus calamus]|uniref:Uncharacterized protein n=1 Tax=Acorus calamus TaxID=4465 RepID=A0AAV9E8N2_ACOCL|nr:hypothetical protein QJS10_CPA09g00795 [Acorus calamus]
MASSIGFNVLSGLPMACSPKIIPSSQTKLKVSSITTQNEGGSSSVAVPRRSGNYNPNIWDHSFMQSLKSDYARPGKGRLVETSRPRWGGYFLVAAPIMTYQTSHL